MEKLKVFSAIPQKISNTVTLFGSTVTEFIVSRPFDFGTTETTGCKRKPGKVIVILDQMVNSYYACDKHGNSDVPDPSAGRKSAEPCWVAGRDSVVSSWATGTGLAEFWTVGKESVSSERDHRRSISRVRLGDYFAKHGHSA